VSKKHSEPMVRPVKAEELGALRDVDRAIFGELAYPFFVLRQHFDAHEGNLLVLEHRGALRGYSLAIRSSRNAELGWILAIGVDPESRRSGFGSLLAEGSLTLLRGQGVKEIRLSVGGANAAAIALYERFGFRRGDRVLEDYLGPGLSRLLMTLHFVEEPTPVAVAAPPLEARGLTVVVGQRFIRGVRELGPPARRPPTERRSGPC
jgi:[ribosomal protein S18]-alanine N-acetyltransferase